MALGDVLALTTALTCGGYMFMRGFVGRNGNRYHYRGIPFLTWRLSRITFTGAEGMEFHYEGNERLIRVTFSSGTVDHFEGERNEERMVKTVRSDGTEVFYEGEMDEECIVKTVRSDGTEVYYQGARGVERMVKTVGSDGKVVYYHGPKDEETPIVHKFASSLSEIECQVP